MATGIVNPYAIATPFSPVDFPFDHLYWAGGPNMLAEGYAAGDSVPKWPCEVTGLAADDLVPEAGFASSNFKFDTTKLNGQESVYFGSTATRGMRLDARWSDYAAMNSAASAGTARAIITVTKKESSNAGGFEFMATNAYYAGGAEGYPRLATYREAGAADNLTSQYYAAMGNIGAAASVVTAGEELTTNVHLLDGKNSDPVGDARSGDLYWINGAAQTSSGAMYGHTAWGWWGIGGRASNSTWSATYTSFGFIGIYQHPTILLRDQPLFDDLNAWFSDTYGQDLIT